MLTGSRTSAASSSSDNIFDELILFFSKVLKISNDKPSKSMGSQVISVSQIPQTPQGSDGSASTQPTTFTPFQCDELTLSILNSLPSKEKHYLPMRRVCKKWKQMIENDVYLKLLNAPEVYEEIQQKVISSEDREALYQKQQKEIGFFAEYQTDIRTQYKQGSIRKALDDLLTLSSFPRNALILYQRHKALEKVNTLMIQAKFRPDKVVLICSQSFISRFPAKLARDPAFAQLKTINISNNFLARIPSAIFQLPCIERILASHNEIEKVEMTHAPAKTLLWIDLHANQLRSFPEVLLGSKDLKQLNLAYNFLLYVPETVWGKKLTIDLSHNCLTDIDARCPNRNVVLKTQTPIEQALTDNQKAERRCSM